MESTLLDLERERERERERALFSTRFQADCISLESENLETLRLKIFPRSFNTNCAEELFAITVPRIYFVNIWKKRLVRAAAQPTWLFLYFKIISKANYVFILKLHLNLIISLFWYYF